MNYATAKQIAGEHAPDLIVGADVPGQMHINVYKTENGAPFSIMLPRMNLPQAIEYRAATPEIPATETSPAIPAMPEVQARSAESILEEQERTAFIYALEAAVRHFGA